MIDAPLDGDADEAGPGPEGLDARQEAAVVALVNQPSVAKAAEACGVPERTLYRWLAEPAFSKAYRRARRLAFSHAIALSQRLAVLAVNVLGKVANDAGAPHAARVSASSAILKFSRESIELDDLAGRIETLEQQSEQAKVQGNRR
jgi:hypothetical protein